MDNNEHLLHFDCWLLLLPKGLDKKCLWLGDIIVSAADDAYDRSMWLFNVGNWPNCCSLTTLNDGDDDDGSTHSDEWTDFDDTWLWVGGLLLVVILGSVLISYNKSGKWSKLNK